jgi:hypothetical protein
MFEELISFISYENNNKSLQEFYDPHEISKFDDEQVEKIFCDITGQSEFKTQLHDIFTYDNKTKQIYESGNNINNVSSSGCPIVFEEMNEYIIISIMQDENLINYLYENENCNYIGFPIYTQYYTYKSAHISLLVFDNVNRKCFYIDSNGKTHDNRKFYDYFFDEKINYLCNFELIYEYEKSEIWNKHNIILNINYNNKELNNRGNCMIWTIFILHIISTTLLHPGELYKKLELLNDDEKIYILKEYAKITTLKYKNYKSTN